MQFHFLYIFVGRVDRIHKTSHTRMLSFYISLQTSNVLGTSWTFLPKRPPQIFELIKIEANIWILQNCVFTMNCSTDKKIVFWSFLGRGFIYMWEKFQRCQSSNSCFLQKCPTFWTDNMQILFFSLNICIFTPVQTKKLAVGRKIQISNTCKSIFTFIIIGYQWWLYSNVSKARNGSSHHPILVSKA